VLINRQMLPTSHLEPIKASPPNNEREAEASGTSASLLADAFSEFISASARLEHSYHQLQDEVSELRSKLSARNAALSTSLEENERMRLDLQQIVDSMPCGVLVLGRDGDALTINPESRALLGLSGTHPEDDMEATLRQVSAISGVNLRSSYEDAATGDSAQELCVQQPSGKRWLEIRNRPLFRVSATGGKADRTILILRDITAQKRAEQEREAARRAMALAELTTVLAHEIRNPLASLELFAELIENDEGHRAEWVSHLRAGIRSLSATVNNVLSFHGSRSLKLGPVSLSTLIGTAIQFVQPLAHQAAVALHWLGADKQEIVMGNESALQQVVLNLISNAIRHTPMGGSVTVSMRKQDVTVADVPQSEHVVIEFADTGCGIRADQIDHIFESGFSGGGDTCGLGLTVCDRIVKQHSGRISVSSEVNRGTRFALILPRLRLEPAATA
jgi:signal transduction histidine kinase